MAAMRWCFAATALVSTAVGREQQLASITPMGKVLELLGNMADKGKEAKHSEEVEFAKFSKFCDGTRESTKKSIGQGESQQLQLEAAYIKADADVEKLSGEVLDLENSVAADEAELKKSRDVRKQEKADYMTTHNDFSESIDAIQRAVTTLKSRGADVAQTKGALLQVRASAAASAQAKATIDSFLALASAGGQTPEANAYEFQSGGVVDLLEKLRLKFQDQRHELQTAEMTAKHNFEMIAQDLSDNVKHSSKVAAAKTGRKAKRVEDGATARGDHGLTVENLKQDRQKLSDTNAVCSIKSEEFEKNQVVRAEEIKAINKASEILRSESVSGAADKHLPALSQVATALVQLRGNEPSSEGSVREKLASFLKGRAASTGSRYLALVATHAKGDPFVKVKKMVKDLIVKLMEQANSEADHKAYCDTELATNKQTREDKQAEVEALSAQIEQGEALSATLAEEIANLGDEVGTILSQQAEATENRQSEKAQNQQTITDAKEAQLAVQRATQVLREFYEGTSGASLLQEGHKMKEPYTGMQSEHGGIMGFLDVILSDFARLEAETSTAEDQAASAHTKFMDDSSQDKVVKETTQKHKAGKLQTTGVEVVGNKKELGLTHEELGAAQKYYDELKPDCVDEGLSFERRVEMREEEIQSLKEALQMLDGEDLAA